MAGSITYVDSSLMHYDDSALTGSVTTVKKPEKLAHSSGSITNNEGTYIHQTLPKTHNDNSKAHRTESKMYTDGSREYKDGTITPGPYDTRQGCLLGRTIHLFYGPAGYVSTTKLLEACQNFHLYARPSEEKLQDLSSKVDHIEKKMHIGWVLKDSSKEQSFTFYVPRLDFKNTKLKHSHEFRYYLRNRLPLLEALLYADGNDLVNREANYIYRSYSVFILRAVIFLIIGYVASKLILLIINNVQSSNALLDKVSHQNGEHDNPYSWINKRHSEDIRKIMEIVERQTKVLVTITIMVGVLISLRVRCLLFLMIPTFGLVVGHVYLANQMIYTSFIGPLTSSKYNMKSVSSVLSCLSKAAYSISRDLNKFDFIDSTDDNASKFSADLILSPNEETFYPLDHISVSSSLLKVIRDTGEKLSSTVVDYKNNLPSLDKLTENYKNLTGKLESSYSKNEISKIHHELARNLSITMKERLDRRIEKYKHDVKHYLEREISSNTNNYFNMNIVSQGMEMEYEMLNNLIHFCMIIHERKFASCLNKAKEICNDLQNNRQFQGSWFSSLCDDHFQAEEFCDLFNYIKAVRQECSVDVISFAPEFGLFSYLKESYESLNVLNSSMKVEIFLNESFINKQSLIWKEWEKENKHMDKPVTYSMNILYYSLLLLTTLLRLTFLLLIYTVHKYISNYLLNVNFDNLYCESTCEMIDRKRLKEVRETLFPLKLSEKSFVLWTKFGYTWKNIKKSLFRLFL
ncbi:unnamed protein product [Heterobilharzia americana]|nr:unnamed protein product [Heterobilharzia americana]